MSAPTNSGFGEPEDPKQQAAELARQKWISSLALPDGPFGPVAMFYPPENIGPKEILVSAAHHLPEVDDAASLKLEIRLLRVVIVAMRQRIEQLAGSNIGCDVSACLADIRELAQQATDPATPKET